ncbi:MAG: HEAT repeat domain-containing protein [Candidatus Schekmanbacteria bacterium]|nr:HEAT repeat domain-containing protein [Candidatus Schekmanbacteria bacterium]
MKIIFADPDESVSRQLAESLIPLGHDIIAAGTLVRLRDLLDEDRRARLAAQQSPRGSKSGGAGVVAPQPAVVILELAWKGYEPLDVLRAFRSSFPDTTVIVFTEVAGYDLRMSCLRAGVAGYIGKSESAGDESATARLLKAITRLQQGARTARKQPRVQPSPEEPVFIRVVNQNRNRCTGRALDLGVTSLSAVLDCPLDLPVGSMAYVDIRLPDADNVIRVHARIVRATNQLLRCQFAPPEGEDRSRLVDYLYRRLNAEPGAAPELTAEAPGSDPPAAPPVAASATVSGPAERDEASRLLLRDLLDDASGIPGPQLRRDLKDAVQKGGGLAEMELARALAETPSPQLKSEILEVMGAVASNAFVQPIREAIYGVTSEAIFARGVIALGKIGGEIAAETLRQLARESTRANRQKLIAEQLRGMAHTDPVGFHLHRLKGHATSARVVSQVGDALRRLGSRVLPAVIRELAAVPFPGEEADQRLELALVYCIGAVGRPLGLTPVLDRLRRRFPEGLPEWIGVPIPEESPPDNEAETTEEERLLARDPRLDNLQVYLAAIRRIVAPPPVAEDLPPPDSTDTTEWENLRRQIEGGVADADAATLSLEVSRHRDELRVLFRRSGYCGIKELRYLGLAGLGALVTDVGELAPALADESWGVRLAALDAAGAAAKRGLEPAVDLIVSACNDNHLEVRERAIELLSTCERGVVALVRLLGSKDWRQREVAARTVGKLQLADAANQLVALLQDPEDLVSLAALEALGELRPVSAASAVGALLKTGARKNVPTVLETLRRIGGPAALEALGPLLDVRGADVIDQAVVSTIERLVESSPGLFPRAAEVAGELLVRAIASNKDAVVRQAARCLGAVPFPNAVVAQGAVQALEEAAKWQPGQKLSLPTREEIRNALRAVKRLQAQLGAGNGAL